MTRDVLVHSIIVEPFIYTIIEFLAKKDLAQTLNPPPPPRTANKNHDIG